jgi:hypothetical protein
MLKEIPKLIVICVITSHAVIQDSQELEVETNVCHTKPISAGYMQYGFYHANKIIILLHSRKITK